ncbi:hypothetical protein MBLNU230_g2284t1 [Neophaeotheca triangularis]
MPQIDADLYAVMCTANTMSAERLTSFFNTTYAYSKEIDCQPSLFLVNCWSELKTGRQLEATNSLISKSGTPRQNEFVNRPIKDIALEFQSHADHLETTTLSPILFVVLDERSRIEDDALVVELKDGEIETARVHFANVNAEIVRIAVILGGVHEVRRVAEESKGGVFQHGLDSGQRVKGGTAPRKKLG